MIIAVFQFGVARVCPFSVRRMVPNGVDRVVSVKSSANSARSFGSAAALWGRRHPHRQLLLCPKPKDGLPLGGVGDRPQQHHRLVAGESRTEIDEVSLRSQKLVLLTHDDGVVVHTDTGRRQHAVDQNEITRLRQNSRCSS